MATIFTENYSGDYGNKYEFKAVATESKASDYITTNKTTVTVNTYVRRTDISDKGAYNLDGTAWSISIDGTKTSGTSTWDTRNTTAWKLIGTAKKTITHNTDGSKTITISASHTGNSASGSSKMGNASGSGIFELTKIPRYATASQSLNSKTVNSIKMNWSSDSTIDYIWYSKDNGSTWTGVDVSDGKSGTYTISGLSVNTTYKIKTRVRRKDSQLETDSSVLSVTTYDIAKLTETPNVNIGSSHTIKWTNPSGAATTLKLVQSSDSDIIDYGTVTGTSKTITDTPSKIYALIPNSNSVLLAYVLTTTVNGTSYINSKICKFYVTNSNPTFSNCTYYDAGNVSTKLTGNNQALINNFNSLHVVISTANKAVANNGATMKKYRLVCGNMSVEANYSSSEDVTLELGYVTSRTFIVYAIDSRGNSTAVTKSIEIWKDYTEPKIKTGIASRTGGVGTETTLSFNGTFWNYSFGAETNTIELCRYRYKRTNSSTWSDYIDITPTISGNNFSFSSIIKGDLEAEGFDLSYSYNIEIYVKDRLYPTTYKVLLGNGSPAMAVHRDGVAFGAPYDESLGGVLQIFGLAVFTTANIKNKDLNDYTTNLIAYGNDCTNRPTGAGNGYLQVIQHPDSSAGNEYCVQIWRDRPRK